MGAGGARGSWRRRIPDYEGNLEEHQELRASLIRQADWATGCRQGGGAIGARLVQPLGSGDWWCHPDRRRGHRGVVEQRCQHVGVVDPHIPVERISEIQQDAIAHGQRDGPAVVGMGDRHLRTRYRGGDPGGGGRGCQATDHKGQVEHADDLHTRLVRRADRAADRGQGGLSGGQCLEDPLAARQGGIVGLRQHRRIGDSHLPGVGAVESEQHTIAYVERDRATVIGFGDQPAHSRWGHWEGARWRWADHSRGAGATAARNREGGRGGRDA